MGRPRSRRSPVAGINPPVQTYDCVETGLKAEVTERRQLNVTLHFEPMCSIFIDQVRENALTLAQPPRMRRCPRWASLSWSNVATPMRAAICSGKKYLLFDELCVKSPIRFNRRHHLLRRHFGTTPYPGALSFEVNTNVCHSSYFYDGLTDRLCTATSVHAFDVEDHIDFLCCKRSGTSDTPDGEQYEHGSHSHC